MGFIKTNRVSKMGFYKYKQGILDGIYNKYKQGDQDGIYKYK